ncbi:stalk domain-containing protein [Sulfoacidibacillus thermotolerans]|uniref:Copper amine oxidase-like N-terminal domain-containing protein n=1 Tax=Sulfoacidibacillus thermotolerans TaxID=1765684 RepID=A0A2U3D7Q3_SULT2|nr:stalk domain-containing protein [Sulfoacidibacillus thermotolerans]PWI57298.1 hypothetical protein BM613_09380 [Sulfoacidibacillus thermotolerans]
MKQRVSVVLGVLTSALLFGSVSYASVGIEQIQASFHNIQLIVDGKTIETSAEPFIYNKNVYVPISTVGHGLGAAVNWVNSTPKVVVTRNSADTGAHLTPLTVVINGQQMPNGVVTSTGVLGVPAADAAYETASGLIPTVDAAGNVDFSQASSQASSGTLLTSLTPSAVSGDFSNPSLYPDEKLSGYYAPTVLGKVYSGNSTIEWGVNSSESAVIPELTYPLNGQAQTLSGMFAVDDLTRNFNGAAELVFVGDGKTIGSTGWVQGGSAPASFSISVSGVSTLQIEYELRGPGGTIYTSGQTYQAPSVNVDGVKGPIVFTDLLQPTLTGVGHM